MQMKASVINLNGQAAETLRVMLDPGYISERTERLEAIEGFLIDQFLDTLHSLRRDINSFLPSVDPHGDADKTLKQ